MGEMDYIFTSNNSVILEGEMMYDKFYVSNKIKPALGKGKLLLLNVCAIIIEYGLLCSFARNNKMKFVIYLNLIICLIYLIVFTPKYIKCYLDFIKLDIVSVELPLDGILKNSEKEYADQTVVMRENGNLNFYQCYYELKYETDDILKLFYLKRSRIIIDSELIMKNAEREKLTRKQRTDMITK
jgi:hypothetical protein